MLAIIDYRAGNQTSVKRALDHLGIPSEIASDPDVLERAEGLIFPGVGAAGQAMRVISSTGLDQAMRRLAAGGRPMLGICLGCQIMLESSEENQTRTLGLLPGRTVRFPDGLDDHDGRPIRVPHMGWNTVRFRKRSPLWAGLRPDDQFYFVHSFYPSPAEELVLGLTWHGQDFCSVYGREGLWALQFHPEKSGRPGLAILSNFYRYCREAGNHAQ
ncbi:MAG: imidazole glycerol phosphate synthase subunit HisH [Deltaproteobacteria bacterium]|jgi:glutamine amidotransferase|nr:imidazole glycerol phosphate synthase subunit HisH [Deltaproteobacteria bacterium]